MNKIINKLTNNVEELQNYLILFETGGENWKIVNSKYKKIAKFKLMVNEKIIKILNKYFIK